ncbi:hypothetical protein EJ110_NYTH15252 [Nymphaea thermarum]|nr:hypothetical protein EJ110_NYTH15252 [Nymphaea thermarum]
MGNWSATSPSSSCLATRFPEVCYSSLSSYAPIVQRSPRQLAQAALAVSLNRARSTHGFVSWLSTRKTGPRLTPREAGALKDCVTTISDSVYRISQSVGELKLLGRSEFLWHISNVQTWVSAALTDENTCMDGFNSIEVKTSRVRAMVRRHVVGVAQVTSNALALVNKIAEEHRG